MFHFYESIAYGELKEPSIYMTSSSRATLYKRAAKRPPATATKLMSKVAPAALEAVAELEPVVVLMVLVMLEDPDEVAVELTVLVLFAGSGSMAAA
jgi:hypothetical protein